MKKRTLDTGSSICFGQQWLQAAADRKREAETQAAASSQAGAGAEAKQPAQLMQNPIGGHKI